MNNRKSTIRKASLAVLALAAAGLSGCAATPPSGPTILVTPGKGIGPQKFQQDDNYCRSLASQRVSGGSSQSVNSSTTKVVGGTLLGTAAGALLGAAGGNAGMGAAIGAGAGLLAGSGAAYAGNNSSSGDMQQQYNINYAQCMASYGNVINH